MKKYLVTIVIGGLLIIFFSIIGLSAFITDSPFIVKLLTSAIPLCLAGLSIYITLERINEIKGGEFDDISKY